mgnify:CR=1 FL=1
MKLKRSVKFIIPAVVVVLIVVAGGCSCPAEEKANEQRRCRRKYCRKFNERRIILRVQQ